MMLIIDIFHVCIKVIKDALVNNVVSDHFRELVALIIHLFEITVFTIKTGNCKNVINALE